jgi:hypothetical protein
VLKVWGFPDVVVAGVLEQYIPDPFAPNHPIAALVNVASAIAAERGFGLPGEELAWEPNHAKFTCARLLEAAVKPSGDEAFQRFEALRSGLSGK